MLIISKIDRIFAFCGLLNDQIVQEMQVKALHKSLVPLFLIFLFNLSCKDNKTTVEEQKTTQITYPSDVLDIFSDFHLILGDGSNVGQPVNYYNEDFFYTTDDGKEKWVVYKTPNAGDTHGSSNNTRTELAQSKKWFPHMDASLQSTQKVMHVSESGDARVAASYSVVVGQIHSADGHENEPLKIFYKKFPGHKKGSVFWNYEINTAGDDNSGRWDFSYPVWGNDFSVVGASKDDFPPEPEDGIELGEEFSYRVRVREGIMYVDFASPGHQSKSFTKNLVESEYTRKEDFPDQLQKTFLPIGQDGVERKEAYTNEGLFYKQGCYNQTNGKPIEMNRVWCAGAETNGGDIKKQFANGNYAEVWFNKSRLFVSPDAVSNQGYFDKNDDYQKPSK